MWLECDRFEVTSTRTRNNLKTWTGPETDQEKMIWRTGNDPCHSLQVKIVAGPVIAYSPYTYLCPILLVEYVQGAKQLHHYSLNIFKKAFTKQRHIRENIWKRSSAFCKVSINHRCWWPGSPLAVKIQKFSSLQKFEFIETIRKPGRSSSV